MVNSATGTSHAKIILIGEHSVVYHQPAIALPLPSIQTIATLNTTPSGHQIISESFTGELDQLPVQMLGIQRLIEQLMERFADHQNGWVLKITSQIPQERGMGSSAAVAVAITRAFFNFYETPLERTELLELAKIEEVETHRNPSGLDAATVSSDQPLWFIKGESGQAFPLNLSGVLVIADTGIKGATKAAIQAVKEKLATDPTAHERIKHLGELTKAAKQAVIDNNLEMLGQILDNAQLDLQALKVSSSELNHLIQVANRAGALGAKLTGGGRGGCMIALAQNLSSARQIASQLMAHGAKQTNIQPFKGATTNG